MGELVFQVYVRSIAQFVLEGKPEKLIVANVTENRIINKGGFKKTKKIYIRFLRLLIFLEVFVVFVSF